MNISEFTGSGPYWLGRVQPKEEKVTIEVDLSDSIKTASDWKEGSGEVSRYNIVDPSKITVEIEKVSFNLGNLVLLAPDPAGGKVGVDFVRVQCVEGKYRETPLAEKLLEEAETLSGLFDSNGRIVYCGAMKVKDPRQNLNANWDNGEGNDWQFGDKKPSLAVKVGEQKNELPEFNEESKDLPIWKHWGEFEKRNIVGFKNDCSNPRNPVGEVLNKKRDCEEVEDPAWENDDKHISTAVIRNAPMRSPWELGFIHRGIPFQTINLKKTGGIDGTGQLADEAHGSIDCSKWDVGEGTKYSDGDAGILDQIKMTEYNKSYGKIDLSVLKVDSPFWSMGESVDTHNQKLFLGLFNKVEKYTAQKFLDLSEETSYVKKEHTPSDDYIPYSNSIWTAFKSIPDSMRRSRLLGPCSNSQDDLSANLTEGSNDAAQEQLIGRTFNLIEGQSVSLPNTFQIIVVAQSIRDLSGEIVRLKNNGDPVKCSDNSNQGGLGQEAALGRFDANIGSNEKIYFDEIRSECRMLVTVEKVHYMADEGSGKVPRARLRVKQIEYLD